MADQSVKPRRWHVGSQLVAFRFLSGQQTCFSLKAKVSSSLTSFIPDSRAQGSTWIANYWLLASFQLIWPQCKDVRCRFTLWDGAVSSFESGASPALFVRSWCMMDGKQVCSDRKKTQRSHFTLAFPNSTWTTSTMMDKTIQEFTKQMTLQKMIV